MYKVHGTHHTRLDYVSVAQNTFKTLFGIDFGPLEMAFHFFSNQDDCSTKVCGNSAFVRTVLLSVQSSKLFFHQDDCSTKVCGNSAFVRTVLLSVQSSKLFHMFTHVTQQYILPHSLPLPLLWRLSPVIVMNTFVMAPC